MLALQYSVFIHDVDNLILLNSQLLLTKVGWGVSSLNYVFCFREDLSLHNGKHAYNFKVNTKTALYVQGCL